MPHLLLKPEERPIHLQHHLGMELVGGTITLIIRMVLLHLGMEGVGTVGMGDLDREAVVVDMEGMVVDGGR